MKGNKIKKFIPPVKKRNTDDNTQATKVSQSLIPVNNDLKIDEIFCNNTGSDFRPGQANFDPTNQYLNQIHNGFDERPNEPYVEANDLCWSNFNQTYQYLNNNMTTIVHENYINHQIIIRNGVKMNKKHSLDGVILGSLKVLIDDNLVSSQNVTTDEISDGSSVKNLSQSRQESFCSVKSLKVYKNLDCNSFEGTADRYDILAEDFLNLFSEFNKPKDMEMPVAMSTQYGDIGLNIKYTDYLNTIDYRDTEMTAEENNTAMIILEMYPNENIIISKINKK